MRRAPSWSGARKGENDMRKYRLEIQVIEAHQLDVVAESEDAAMKEVYQLSVSEMKKKAQFKRNVMFVMYAKALPGEPIEKDCHAYLPCSACDDALISFLRDIRRKEKKDEEI